MDENNTAAYNIGDNIAITGTVVDYNAASKKAKISIKGYAEDKMTPKEIFIWMDSENVAYFDRF